MQLATFPASGHPLRAACVAFGLAIASACAPAWAGEVAAGKFSFSNVHAFNSIDGFCPCGSLVLASDGHLYGTTSGGGLNNAGVLFKLSATGTLTVLHQFTGGVDGGSPFGGLTVSSDGNLYGTTSAGGANGKGTVFLATRAGAFTVLHAFAADDSEGRAPYAAPIQASDGNFYGTTRFGGSFDGGTIYRMTPGGTLSVLRSFEWIPDGGMSEGRLVQASDGKLYGTTLLGGGGDGTLFRMGLDGAYQVLHYFSEDIHGNVSQGPLVQASDGHLYGANQWGGTYGLGTVYRMDLGGQFQVLHAFDGSKGTQPNGGLVQGADGHLYGMTRYGGKKDIGTVYRITTKGAMRLLRNFHGEDGWKPRDGLLGSSDGSFYGATCGGGSHGYGNIFRMTPTAQ